MVRLPLACPDFKSAADAMETVVSTTKRTTTERRMMASSNFRGRRMSTPSNADALGERDEAWFVAQRRERQVDVEPDDRLRPLLVQLLQQVHRLVLLAEGGVDAREEKRKCVRRRRLQLRHRRERLLAIAGDAVDVAGHRHEERLVSRQLHAF